MKLSSSMFPTCPSIDKNVLRILDMLNAEYEPEYVSVRVEPDALKESCYFNVQRKIAREGGSIHYGWAIWQTPLLYEAEHHAVWEDSEGNFTCITPRDFEIATILFVPDNSKPYSGISYDNVRLNVTGNPIIDDFIKIAEINEMIYALGKRTGERQVHLPAFVLDQIERNRAKQQNIGLFYLKGGRLGTNCFCGKIKSYSECHGKNVVGTALDEFEEIRKYMVAHDGQ